MQLTLLKHAFKRQVQGMCRLLICVPLAAAALVLPQSPSATVLALSTFSSPPAGPSLTITLPDKAQLVARMRVTVYPIQIRCGPFDSGNYYGYGTSFTVRQVDANKVNVASGSLDKSLVCDGAFHSYTGTANVSAGSPPFHGGSALVDLSAYASGQWNGQYYNLSSNASKQMKLR